MNHLFWRDRYVLVTGMTALDGSFSFAILTLLTPPAQGLGPFGGVFD